MAKYKVIFEKKVYAIRKKTIGNHEVEARSRKEAIRLVEKRIEYFQNEANYNAGEYEVVKAFAIETKGAIYNL